MEEEEGERPSTWSIGDVGSQGTLQTGTQDWELGTGVRELELEMLELKMGTGMGLVRVWWGMAVATLVGGAAGWILDGMRGGAI